MSDDRMSIAEIEARIDAGEHIQITPSGEVKIKTRPTVHVLEDVLRISELEDEVLKLKAEIAELKEKN